MKRSCVVCGRNYQQDWLYTCEQIQCHYEMRKYRTSAKDMSLDEAERFLKHAKSTLKEMQERKTRLERFIKIAKAIDRHASIAQRTGKGFYLA